MIVLQCLMTFHDQQFTNNIIPWVSRFPRPVGLYLERGVKGK